MKKSACILVLIFSFAQGQLLRAQDTLYVNLETALEIALSDFYSLTHLVEQAVKLRWGLHLLGFHLFANAWVPVIHDCGLADTSRSWGAS